MILELMHKRVDLDALPVLYAMSFDEASFLRDFDIRGGEWAIQDGKLVGKNRENSPGMVISRDDYFGSVMLDFEARTIPPCTHDINCMWSGSWDYKTNTRSTAYVAGLEGWWNGKVGFEKSPGYTLNCGTKLWTFVPGEYYHIQCGSIGGHVFVMVNSQLAIEMTDPDPIDQTRFGRVGFEAYCSQIQIRSFQIKQLTYTAMAEQYEPEF